MDGVLFETCASFEKDPPFWDTSLQDGLAIASDSYWCPTVSEYSRSDPSTQTHWGFCHRGCPGVDLDNRTAVQLVGPRVISAQYTRSGTAIEVDLDGPVPQNEALLPEWFACESLLHRSSHPLGRCRWINNMRTLLIEPSMRAAVSELKFLAGAFYAEGVDSPEQIVKVRAPIAVNMTVPDLQAPSSVSRVCNQNQAQAQAEPISSSIELDASRTLLSPLITRISFMYRKHGTEEASSVAGCYFDSDLAPPSVEDYFCALDLSALDQETDAVEVALSVRNIFGHSLQTPWRLVTIYEANALQLHVDQPSWFHLALNQVRTIRAHVTRCDGSPAMGSEIYWEVKPTSAFFHIDPSSMLMPTVDKHVVQLIPANARQLGIAGHTFQVKVTAVVPETPTPTALPTVYPLAGSTSRPVSSELYVEVRASDLVVEIAGGNRTIADFSKEFDLNAVASYDPDSPHSKRHLTFEWHCTPARVCLALTPTFKNAQGRRRPGFWEFESATAQSHTSEHVSSQQDLRTVRAFSNDPILGLRAIAEERQNLRRGEAIIFSLRLSAEDGRSALAPAPIHVDIGAESSSSVLHSAVIQVFPHSLSAGSLGQFAGSCGDAGHPSWGLRHPFVASSDTTLWFPSGSHTDHEVVAGGRVFIVNTTVLMQNFHSVDRFTFVLHCEPHALHEVASIASVEIPLNLPPTDGTFSADPLVGTAGKTEFTLSTWGWLKAVGASASPLRYHFEFSFVGDHDIPTLATRSSLNAVHKLLLPNLGGTRAQVHVTAVAMDVLGATRRSPRAVELTLHRDDTQNDRLLAGTSGERSTNVSAPDLLPPSMVSWLSSSEADDTFDEVLEWINVVGRNDIFGALFKDGRDDLACALSALLWKRLENIVTVTFVERTEAPTLVLRVLGAHWVLITSLESGICIPARGAALRSLRGLVEMWNARRLYTMDAEVISSATTAVMSTLDNILSAPNRSFSVETLVSACSKLNARGRAGSDEDHELLVLAPLCRAAGIKTRRVSPGAIKAASVAFDRLYYGSAKAVFASLAGLTRLHFRDAVARYRETTLEAGSILCRAWRAVRVPPDVSASMAENGVLLPAWRDFGPAIGVDVSTRPFDLLVCRWSASITARLLENVGPLVALSREFISLHATPLDNPFGIELGAIVAAHADAQIPLPDDGKNAKHGESNKGVNIPKAVVSIPLSNDSLWVHADSQGEATFGSGKLSTSSSIRVRSLYSTEEHMLLVCGMWNPAGGADAEHRKRAGDILLDACSVSAVVEGPDAHITAVACSCSGVGIVGTWLLDPSLVPADPAASHWYISSGRLVLLGALTITLTFWIAHMIYACRRDLWEHELYARALFVLAVRGAQMRRAGLRSGLLELRRLRAARLRLRRMSDLRAQALTDQGQEQGGLQVIGASSSRERCPTGETLPTSSVGSVSGSGKWFSSSTESTSGRSGLRQRMVTLGQYHLYLSVLLPLGLRPCSQRQPFERLRQSLVVGFSLFAILLLSFAIAVNVEDRELLFAMIFIPGMGALPATLAIQALLESLPVPDGVLRRISAWRQPLAHRAGRNKRVTEACEATLQERHAEVERLRAEVQRDEGVSRSRGSSLHHEEEEGARTWTFAANGGQGEEVREARVNVADQVSGEVSTATRRLSTSGGMASLEQELHNAENALHLASSEAMAQARREQRDVLLHELQSIAFRTRVKESGPDGICPAQLEQTDPFDKPLHLRIFVASPRAQFDEISHSACGLLESCGLFWGAAVGLALVICAWAYPLASPKSSSQSHMWIFVGFYAGALAVDLFIVQNMVALARLLFSESDFSSRNDYRRISPNDGDMTDDDDDDDDDHDDDESVESGVNGLTHERGHSARNGPQGWILANGYERVSGDQQQVEMTTLPRVRPSEISGGPGNGSRDASSSSVLPRPDTAALAFDASSSSGSLVLVPDRHCINLQSPQGHHLHQVHAACSEDSGDERGLEVLGAQPLKTHGLGTVVDRLRLAHSGPRGLASVSPSSAGGLQAFLGFQEEAYNSDLDGEEELATRQDLLTDAGGIGAGALMPTSGARADLQDDGISYDGMESTVSSYAKVPQHLLEEESSSFFDSFPLGMRAGEAFRGATLSTNQGQNYSHEDVASYENDDAYVLDAAIADTCERWHEARQAGETGQDVVDPEEVEQESDF
ncbi:Hypothetical Protein FCC1311_105072 [Hondaea fermentalgiana]|uniref:PKD/REJ-like domain-containing protein n=1 Tax=Hondaea fermentalgiana TaxID=2315210 RepID=A0A2R5H1Q6_9STRA|nr:Hypothetical Protein FCC1311_105072 [Hondaea fermentalgiana]|eukprot:GBG34284.1 Hypothetical Protein FCC1311_105072 [Hondaea fermentalgiana]